MSMALKDPTMVVSMPFTCVVLMPFSAESADTFVSVSEALEPLGVATLRLGGAIEIQTATSIERRFSKGAEFWHITEADLVIADITGSDPNVMYEIGIAHALRKPTLLIGRRNADPEVHQFIPHDLREFIVFWYDSSDLEQLVNFVAVWARNYLLRATE